MKWKCLLSHDYLIIGARNIEHYEGETDVRPYKHTTRILYGCKNCHKLKIKTLVGNWRDAILNNENDDDDDDNDGDKPENGPILSPDDYFELQENQK